MQITCGFSEEKSMVEFAARLARVVRTPLVFGFRGELGVGKTTLIRAMLRALQVQGLIKSPTFSLVETYSLPERSKKFHHFDLYRVTSPFELDDMGFRDYFTSDALCCIEWPERALGYSLGIDVNFQLQFAGQGRLLHLSAPTLSGIDVLTTLNELP